MSLLLAIELAPDKSHEVLRCCLDRSANTASIVSSSADPRHRRLCLLSRRTTSILFDRKLLTVLLLLFLFGPAESLSKGTLDLLFAFPVLVAVIYRLNI